MLTYFDPIIVRIQDEGNILHPAIRHPLFPIDSLFFKSLTRSFHVVDRYADMAESLRLIVSIVVLELSVFFSAIIPCQLQNTFLVGCGDNAVGQFFGNGSLLRISKEISISSEHLYT